MSIVLKTFFPFFTILSFYTKHMFKFIYVNQVIHMVILVDNVDKFVHNLIIGGFADFCHVENFLESFSLIHHGSTSFVHIARTTFSGLILPVSARTFLMLPILSNVYTKPFFLQLFMGPDGVWNAFWITEVFTAIVSVMVYRKSLKKA